MTVIYRKVSTYCHTPWWMKHAYFDASLNKRVMVAFPLNYVFSFAWFLNLKWGEFRHKPTWIDHLAHSHLFKK